MFKSILLIGFGGALGSICRYLLGQWITKMNSSNFPLGTFTVNIIGSFIIGIFIAYFSNTSQSSVKLFLISGFCGGFTTFSAFTAENINLIQSGQWSTAFIYTLCSLVLGIVAVFLGINMMRYFL